MVELNTLAEFQDIQGIKYSSLDKGRVLHEILNTPAIPGWLKENAFGHVIRYLDVRLSIHLQ